MECRVLKNKKCKINQDYSSKHPAIDIVGANNTLDNIIAHTKGTIVDALKAININSSYQYRS